MKPNDLAAFSNRAIVSSLSDTYWARFYAPGQVYTARAFVNVEAVPGQFGYAHIFNPVDSGRLVEVQGVVCSGLTAAASMRALDKDLSALDGAAVASVPWYNDRRIGGVPKARLWGVASAADYAAAGAFGLHDTRAGTSIVLNGNSSQVMCLDPGQGLLLKGLTANEALRVSYTTVERGNYPGFASFTQTDIAKLVAALLSADVPVFDDCAK